MGGRILSPELDAGRACADDADYDCAWREGLRAFRRRPDDPSVHLYLAAIASLRRQDIPALLAQEHFLDAGEAFAATPPRADLLPLIWWISDYDARVDENRSGDDLLAERRAILARLDDVEPVEEEDAIVLALLRLAMSKADDDAHPQTPPDVLEALADDPDPVVQFLLVKNLPLGSDPQRVLIDRLLRGDPAQPRYPAYLLFAAASSHDPVAALKRLAGIGLPSPGYDDDLVEILAATSPGKRLDPPAAAALEALLRGERKRDTSEHAAVLLALDAETRGDYEKAASWLDLFESRFGRPLHDFGPIRARLFARQHRWAAAADAQLAAIRRGGTDYTRLLDAARYLQKSKRRDEAIRLYQFYLVQVENRMSGALPFGPPAGPRELAIAYAKVWGHFAEIQPGFFSHAGLAQLLELLGVAVAAILAAARLPRAKAFILPGALAAEIAFFSGLAALRSMNLHENIPVTAWLWLATVTGRVFVLAGGGLYLGALAGLPRRSRAPAWLLLAGCAVALLAGRLAGAPAGPRYILHSMPAVARLGELRQFPERFGEIPALLVSTVRADAALLLVWPALAFVALGIRQRPPSRTRRLATGFALAATVAFAATVSPFPFFAAAVGCSALMVARVRFGAIAPFLLHGCFAAGAVVAVVATRGLLP